MKGIEYFRINDSEELVMGEQWNPSNCNEIRVIYVNILPFPYVVISLHSGQIHFEMYEVADEGKENSHEEQYFRQVVVDSWFQIGSKGQT